MTYPADGNPYKSYESHESILKPPLTQREKRLNKQYSSNETVCFPPLIHIADLESARSLVQPRRQSRPKLQNNFLMKKLAIREWLAKRYADRAKKNYFQTDLEMMTDDRISEMFAVMDLDGGGTVSVGEVTALFKSAGIDSSMEEIADMFAEAQRRNSYR